jgi:hypothetical protein
MDFNKLATKEVLNRTVLALQSKKYEVAVVKNKLEALEKIKTFIPQRASVMNGSSTTLTQIGFIDYLKSGNHDWNNLHANILAENDPIKQNILRKQSVLSDYYLGSVHALVENGEFLIASNTGSQLPHIVFTSTNLIFAISTKKIVPTNTEGIKRINEHILPLEDKRMHEVYGIGTSFNKMVTFKDENPIIGRKIHMILIEEDLGF